MVNELPTPLNTVVKLEDKSEPYEGTGKKKRCASHDVYGKNLTQEFVPRL